MLCAHNTIVANHEVLVNEFSKKNTAHFYRSNRGFLCPQAAHRGGNSIRLKNTTLRYSGCKKQYIDVHTISTVYKNAMTISARMLIICYQMVQYSIVHYVHTYIYAYTTYIATQKNALKYTEMSFCRVCILRFKRLPNFP